jgi:hypothetical protein
MADYIRPTPRNPILGLLSDALTGGVEWMRSPQRTQQMQGLGGLLAETGIPATVERLSYGEPLTTGRGMTTRLRPEAEAALMTLGPEAVPIGRGAMAGARAAGRGAMAVGRAGEQLAERVVPQVMERGGLPAQLLEGMASQTVSPMIKLPTGRIPESAEEIRKFVDMLSEAGTKKGYGVSVEGSNISPSKYVTFSKDDDIYRQVRISNHPDKYPERAIGTRTSVDPETQISFEQAVNWLDRQGFPTELSTKYKDVPSWEQYYKMQDEARSIENAARLQSMQNIARKNEELLNSGNFLLEPIKKIKFGAKSKPGYEFLGKRFYTSSIPEDIKNQGEDKLKEYLANAIKTGLLAP